MKDEITITKADFDTAIQMTMQKNMEDPHFKGHPEAALVYALGGATFAREVKRVLFEEEEEGDT